MFVLTFILVVAVVLSAVVRGRGASRRVSVGLSSIPALAAFVFYSIRSDIDVGPHGGIVPAWKVAGIVVILVVTVSTLVSRIAGRRG